MSANTIPHLNAIPLFTTLRSRPVWLYLAVAYGVSWLFWVPAAVAQFVAGPGSWPPLVGLVGALGPGVAAQAVAAATGGRLEVRRLLGRLGRWRFGRGWYAAALLLAGLLLAAYGVARLLGAAPTPADLTLGAIVFAALIQIPNTLAEELGWRGWLLPHLQARTTALSSSLVLGVIWLAWHTPYWLAQDTGPDLFLLNLLEILAASVVLTWLVNNTGGSVLPAWLAHWTTNIVLTLIPVMPGAAGTLVPYALAIGGIWAAAAVILRVYGPAHLTRPAPAPRLAGPYAPPVR
jgi:membrane protease YdiL (CAAX protease family)